MMMSQGMTAEEVRYLVDALREVLGLEAIYREPRSLPAYEEQSLHALPGGNRQVLKKAGSL